MENAVKEIDKLSLVRVKFSVDTTADKLADVLKVISQSINLLGEGVTLAVNEISYLGHDWYHDEKYLKDLETLKKVTK